MDLRTYLFQKRLSVTDFSDKLGCSRIHLSGVVNGKRIPSLLLAKSIEKFTNGEVTVEELLKGKDNGQD
jgi:transcriptional regulator with XRE-family HTH domain